MNERPITRRSALKLAGAAGALGMAGLPIEALASDPEDAKKLFIGMDLHAVGPEATTGTMVIGGVFADGGTSNAQPRVTPKPNSDRGRLEGDQQFIGQKGTLFTHFEGVAIPFGSPRAVGLGRVTIVSGTGDYANVRGMGSFLIVVDFITNQLIGTETITIEGT